MHDDNKLTIKVEANFNSNLLVDNINFLALHPMSNSCYLINYCNEMRVKSRL